MLARVGPRLIHSKVLGPSLSGQRRGLLSAIASAHHAPWYCLRPKQSLSTVQESQQTPGNRYAPKGHLKHRCFVAFGGNEGSKASKIGMIERACNVLDNYEDILLVRSSSLYETRPMYYTDQPDFINGVCEVR